MANPSAGTIIDLARSLIRAEAGSDVPAVGDIVMLQAITDADKELYRAHRRGGGNTPQDRALETGFTLISETAIDDSSGITSASTSITADSNSFIDSAGASVVWDADMPDIFYYTSKTSTVFSGVTGIAFDHEDNDAIQPLYKLPSNFRSFRRSEEYGDGVQLNGVPLRHTDGPPNQNQFSLVDDGTSKYLWLPRQVTGDASVLFDKTSNTIDSTDDLVSFGQDWLFFYAWRAIELSLFGRGDYEIIAFAKQKGDAAKLDNLKDRNVGRMVRVRQLATTRTYRDYLPDYENE